jgi:ATP-dependent Clp protease ATP-binding subunit ClpC
MRASTALQTMFGFLLPLLLLLAFQEEDVVAFVPAPLQGPVRTTMPMTMPRQRTRTRHSFVAAPHNVVFTRLSEDCISALGKAQEQAMLSKQDEIDNTFLLLGICDSPGRTKSTLERYEITWQSIRRILNYLNKDHLQQKIKQSRSGPKLSDFSEPIEDSMLPYSNSLQQTLFQAGKISQVMGSPAIEPEHIFLALLQYREVDGEAQAATRGDDCDAMEILYHIDAQLEGEDICESLLQALMEDRTNPKKKEAPSTTVKNQPKATIPAPPTANTSSTAAAEAAVEPSLLEQFGSDLTKQAEDGELDIVHGRDDEIQSCLRILLRRRKNNVCMIGEAGVGKTSIAEGLAQVLVSENCPALLKGHRIRSIEVGALLSGTKFRGSFEERLRAIIQELSSDDTPPTILFLDEIHTLMGTGAAEGGGMDAANLLKPYLARGKLRVIGATTIVEYNKFIAKDAAMERRFQPVLIREPTVEQTVQILRALLPFYTAHHRVEFEDASLEAAAKLSDRYIPDRFLPDKAIDLLDEAGALATLTRMPNEPPPIVTEKIITKIVSEWSSIPAGKLEMDEMERLQALEENMARRVKGQERAVRTVAKAIRRARTGIVSLTHGNRLFQNRQGPRTVPSYYDMYSNRMRFAICYLFVRYARHSEIQVGP